MMRAGALQRVTERPMTTAANPKLSELLFPRWKWPLIGFAFLASLARVFELDHYTSDILASAFVAVLLAFLLAKAFRIQPHAPPTTPL